MFPNSLNPSWIATIEAAWEDQTTLTQQDIKTTIHHVLELLDKGIIRAAELDTAIGWKVNEWVKKAILLYFMIQPMNTIESGSITYHDKIPIKNNFKDTTVRVVPPAIARYGTCLRPGVVLMASYVNIGAYIDENTMIDIGAVIGSCAQIGKNIHVSAHAVIGGVLEPLQARPVIIEDGTFIGAHCTVVEGVLVGQEAVLGANVVLTNSTKIFDVTQPAQPKEYKGYIPPRSVVIPGTYPKTFAAGTYEVPCALIIGQRTAHTNLKTSLNETLRKYDLNLS